MQTDKKILKSLNKKPKTLFFWRGYILDWVIDIAIAIVIVYITTTFAFQNMYVVGNSMSPTLNNGETVLVNKLTYQINEPLRNDIVTFRHVDSSDQEINIVKRIIGLPGDKIEVIDHLIYLNDQALEDPVAAEGNMQYPLIVPENSYFVLGDNKAHSIDSRHKEIGLISAEELQGRIFMRIWPFWKVKLID